MARILMTSACLVGFPLLIFCESIVGLPIMSLFFFLSLSLRSSMTQRLWWLVYVSGWLALWYHAWWWQTALLLVLLLISSQLMKSKRWVFGGIVFLASMGGLLMGVLFSRPSGEDAVGLIGLQFIVASMFWWWLWRWRVVVMPSSTWYIR